MKQLINLPLISSVLREYDEDGGVRAYCNKYECDGIEAIWGGTLCDEAADLPIVGWHLGFYCDWLDFWLQDEEALIRKFGNLKTVEAFYGGLSRDALVDFFVKDLERAEKSTAEYVVFHVSDVSIEEGYTYKWLHTHEQVIEESVKLINLLLDGKNFKFKFLMENLHWAGLTFENLSDTKMLINGVNYERKGLLLDTGHLFCTNTEIKNEAEGIKYTLQKIEKHSELIDYIMAIHLHKSISGNFVKNNTGFLPKLPEEYFERFSKGYGHILKIDRHQPFSNSKVLDIISAIKPDYLVHELSGATKKIREARLKVQRKALLQLSAE